MLVKEFATSSTFLCKSF